MKAINIIIDWTDGQNPIFVEVEDDYSRSLDIGTMEHIVIDGKKMTKLRITPEDITNASTDRP